MSVFAVNSAIATWILTGSQLSADRVIWARQKAGVRPKPYIEMRITRTKHGTQWLVTKDAISPTPGRELEYTAQGAPVATLTLRCFASDAIDDDSPEEILSRVQLAAQFPTILEGLRAAGIGLGRFEDVSSMDGVINSTILEPRASMSVSLHLAAQMSEFGTYIETYELEQVAIP
jgi:hypothetical protein